MRPVSFAETGNYRELLKARLSPIERLIVWARIAVDDKAVFHYQELLDREYDQYYLGLGCYQH